MLPHLGAGAGQGIEDALLLTRLLGHPDTCIANMQVRRASNVDTEVELR